jgi:hypothetical protein
MTKWVKLHLIVEGQTERAFARDTLKPHLAQYHVSVNPFMLLTNRKLGAVGGALSWDRFRYNVSGLLKQFADKSDRFSTMIDWYKLDPHFPGTAEAGKLAKAADRASAVANAVKSHFDSSRLVPFFTLHEFEALLFCDLSTVARRLSGRDKGVASLKKEIGSTPPEDVDDGPNTHPSARLEKHLPGYHQAKVRVGAPAAGEIGLHVLRGKCPHFGQWLTRLENLGGNALKRNGQCPTTNIL